jgi:hypothetical protein
MHQAGGSLGLGGQGPGALSGGQGAGWRLASPSLYDRCLAGRPPSSSNKLPPACAFFLHSG